MYLAGWALVGAGGADLNWDVAACDATVAPLASAT